MKLACIVLAHHRPKQLATLLAALRHPSVEVYLHVDRRASLIPFTRAFEEAGIGDVALLPRYRSRWASLGIIDATLAGLSAGVAGGCDYFVLLSGQDFPLKPVEEIVTFFEDAGSTSYMSYFPVADSPVGPPGESWHGRHRTEFYTYTVRGRRELCIPWGEKTSQLSLKGRVLNELLRVRSAVEPPRRHPAYAQPFLGAQWWNLSRVAAEYILRFVTEHPDFRRYHRHTMSPDDMFFQTILVGTEFASDHQVVNAGLRFLDWNTPNGRPATLTIDHLPDLLASDKLFARKFDATVDPRVIEVLADRISV
jgi:core-2/I-Branching enzyme